MPDQTDNSSVALGAVDVFVRASRRWSQQAYIKFASSSSTRDRETFVRASNTDRFDE